MEEWRNWTKEELEHQMSPSRWNVNKNNGDDVIRQHIVKGSVETQRMKEKIPHKLDISYSTLGLEIPSQRYDLYGTDLPDNAPIFFWIHGGYWQEGSKDISSTMAENLYSIGVKTLVFEYTLAPNASIFQIQTELYMALNQVMETYSMAKVIVGGHSAGGHLAATLLHRDNEKQIKERVTALVLVSGVFDLRPLVPTYVNEALKMTNSDAEKLSPLLLPLEETMIKADIPVLLCVGAYESTEFKRQTEDYARKLKQKLSHVQTMSFENDDHFTIVETLNNLTQNSSGLALRKFLELIINL